MGSGKVPISVSDPTLSSTVISAGVAADSFSCPWSTDDIRIEAEVL